MNEHSEIDGKAPAHPFPLRVRIIQIIFLVLAVIATLLLAWWQWNRWQSNGGSFQNLGYAIQWPIFGIFFVVAYRKYIQYEKERLQGDVAPAAPAQPSDDITEVPQDFLQANKAEDIWVDDRRERARMRASKNKERENNNEKGH
ncbi:hypothetical protein ACN4EB_05265 [Corynebacterium macclintockiae]|uniref:DNA-binding transcriptional regulator of glucitol operon n=1 Tax=Corynebacterium macclintockiae TaxID=2913501 RepID=A0A9X3M7K1_9CORY|nr:MULTISPECIES: hypothetical protein [Corynebacterium]MBC6794459.1 hypothetical protein [Corynebacterium sp. LK28]MCZ9305610.1 hypothetical protein [Corynebacterium macclintockiae]MDK8869691.1 hypothetical protein [Corynebacterium macclintockiae]OFM55081.1 hypothetical protein HMPREF2678_02440 [Corynebacterium sp. HMSC058E07]